MKKRKHICLITADFKELNARRLVMGTTAQCKKYDYDLSVFSTATTLKYFNQQYTNGAINIYRLINFEKFDGIIVDTLTLSNSEFAQDFLKCIYDAIKTQARGPVVNISFEYEGYNTVNSQNEEILRSMCRHMIEVHGYQKFCILTGPKGNVEAEQRLSVFLDEIEKHGLTVSPDSIVYGDFWFSSGEMLADRILSGEVEKPDAVICASDHMGLGLIGRLTKHGIRVPEDIAVIGFEGVEVAMLNDISLTTYESNTMGTAAEAVDYIRSIIEPDREIMPFAYDPKKGFCGGSSCGCNLKAQNLINVLGSAIYRTERNYEDAAVLENIDIGYLMEGYCYEQLSASKDIADCLHNIGDTAYNVFPFENFYLCLRDKWDDLNEDITSGFPEKMKMVVRRNEITHELYSSREGISFETKEMLPGLLDAREEPSVFYFTSIHFNDKIFGYSVIQRKMGSRVIDIVYRNWLRFVCNSLEMIRMRETYFNMSLRDPMTGLTNKRGMYEALNRMMRKIGPQDRVYVAVIDMDGLKYINDTFGHIEGDLYLKRLAHIINMITKENEICVRAGGDEFYIIGAGPYTEESLTAKIKEFEQVIAAEGTFPDKDYKLSASIGNTMWNHEKVFDIDEIIKTADEKMYSYKVAHKKARVQ